MPGTSTVFPFCTAPETYGALVGLQGGGEFDTTVVRARNGYEQRRKNQASVRWSESIGWNPAIGGAPDRDLLRQLWDFYCDRNGRFQSFPYFSFDTNAVWLLELGVGDGVETTFDCRARNATSRTFYDDGTPTADGTHTPLAGTYGQDEVVFNTAPVAGHVITLKFTGQRFGAMRFVDDKLTYRALVALTMSVALEVEEVFGE